MADSRLADPVGDGPWRWSLMALVRFRAWLLGSVYTAGSLIMLLSDDGLVLLVKPWYRRGWGLPGGTMKRAEQSADTASRELREETGLSVELDEAHDVYVQRNRRHIDHLYVVRVETSRALVPKAGGEIRAALWHRLEALPPLQREAHEALRRVRMRR